MVQENHKVSSGPRVPRTHCIRCGTCCMKGGPTLHEEDAVLFTKEALRKTQVYTLRKGEFVRNLDDTLMILDEEMIKIKGEGNAWSCLLYDDGNKSCKIYRNRPVECRALKCWDPEDLIKTMARPRLQRMDLISPDDDILKVIGAHEQRCNYENLESSIMRLQQPDSEKAVQQILELLQYDHHVRRFMTDNLNMDPNETDFFFGRPLATTIRRFGLYVREEGNRFVLTRKE